MIDRVQFFYSGVRFLPPVRNLLRGICLSMGVQCEFVSTHLTPKVVYQDRSIPFLQQSWIAGILSVGQTTDNICLLSAFTTELAEKLLQTPSPTQEMLRQWVDYALAYVSNAWNDGQSAYSKNIVESWKKNYGVPHVFDIKSQRGINTVNLQETSVYKKLFEKASAGVQSIDDSIRTLLEVLPDDVEKILDIGSGPGYVNRQIPGYYDVLAMDLDEEILSQNIRPWCVGDVLEIPLPDNAVDLTIACDVIEHIEEKNLAQAVKEIQRVSKKYIYIQVPNHENFYESFAKCGACSRVWHVNFHKNAFSLNRLSSLLGDEWFVSEVNFTGEVQNTRQANEEYEFLNEHGVPVHMVENWECPYCKGQSVVQGANYFHLAQTVAREKSICTETLSRYSELGVLWVHTDVLKADVIQGPMLYQTWCGDTATVDFTVPISISDTFTGTEQVPTLFMSGCSCSRNEQGSLFLVNGMEQTAWISVAFPFTFNQVQKVLIEGTIPESGILNLCAVNAIGGESTIQTLQLVAGDFHEQIVITQEWKLSPGYLKIYFEGSSILLRRLNITTDQKVPYTAYYSTMDSSHRGEQVGKQYYRWFLPQKRPVYFCQDETNIGEQKENCVLNVQDFLDYSIYEKQFYIELLKERSAQYISERDLWQKNIAFQESQEQVHEYQRQLLDSQNHMLELQQELRLALKINQSIPLVEQQLQHALKINQFVPLLEQQLQHALKINQSVPLLEQQLQGAMEQLEVLGVMELQLNNLQEKVMQYEAIICLLQGQIVVGPRSCGLARKVKSSCLLIMRPCFHFAKKVIRKVPFLYEALVKLGVKRAYQRIKLVVKEGEKYE